MMILNIMGHLPLTEHIKAYSICFQLLGQQFEFSVFCFNSLAYGIVQGVRRQKFSEGATLSDDDVTMMS